MSANGQTLRLISFSRLMAERVQPEWVQKERDRSLHGKDRIRARRSKRTA